MKFKEPCPGFYTWVANSISFDTSNEQLSW